MKYGKLMPERDERIIIIKQKYIDRNLLLTGDFNGISNLMRSKINTQCLVCGHRWLSNPDKIINQGRGCPICGRKATGEKNRKILLKKSLDAFKKYGDYDSYRKFVRTYTFQTIKNFSPFGTVDLNLGHKKNHIDHIRSVFDCFRDRIPPEICGSNVNLQILNWVENLEKYNKSWQTKEDLFEKYNQWVLNNKDYIGLIESLPGFTFQCLNSNTTSTSLL